MMLPGITLDVEEEAWTLGPFGEITLVECPPSFDMGAQCKTFAQAV